MASSQPTPQMSISNQDARRFLLAHHALLPPRKLDGKKEILEHLKRTGCIQYDTINVVGRNADLVLQARVNKYNPELLDEMLYKDRTLVDGWDKMASIYRVGDYPYFSFHRERLEKHYSVKAPEQMKVAPEIINRIREDGPLSSLDFKDDHHEKSVDWFWGSTKLARATLETLYAIGRLGIHHKVNTRRVFDLIENLLPSKILQSQNPNATMEEYYDWHVHRRLGSLGLAINRNGEFWYGIGSSKAADRRDALGRLIGSGKVIPLKVEGTEKIIFFMRKADLPLLKKIQKERPPKAQAAFIAPLDNFMWDRKMIEQIFGFEYIWEVYKPEKDRQYGYYTLPVIYGDQIIGRIDAKMDRKSNSLGLNGFWMGTGVEPSRSMETALQRCMRAFSSYLATDEVKMVKGFRGDKAIGKMLCSF